MSRFVPIVAALFAAFAAWLSQGTIGFADPAGHRLAVLPLSLLTLLIATAAALVVLGLSRSGASLLPLAGLGLVLMPWLPIPVPSAFLLWAFPVSILIWMSVLGLMATSLAGQVRLTVTAPRRAAAALALLVFSLSAWRAAPMVPGGDEPHYLVITQSLLLDGDLTIEDVHRRGDYRSYYPGDLAPHVQRRGRDGRIYSVHAPGLPLLVTPAFALGGYRGAVVFLLLLAALGSALAWHVAWMVTRRTDAAWFGWAAVTLPATAIFQSFTIYPDGAGGVLALTALWALARADEDAKAPTDRMLPWFWHGAALACLPWFHSRFAVLAGGFGALILLRLSRTRNPATKAVAFLSMPAVSAILWIGFFVAIYGTPDPSAPYAAGELGSMSFVPGGLGGLLFDQRFGLFTYAPVLAVAFVGLALMIGSPTWRRFGLELSFVIVPYLLTVTHFAMWWGGWSAPARFFAPVLQLFVVPAAVAWILAHGRAGRFLASASLALTAIASAIVVGVDRGRLAFNTREAPALWLEWLGRLADLTAAAPRWARETDVPLFRAIAIWVAMAVVVWIVLRCVMGLPQLRRRAAFQTLGLVTLAGAVMIGSSIVWALEGSNGRTTVTSQLRLLDAVAMEGRVLALQLYPFAPVSPANVPGRLRIELTRELARRPGVRDTPPLFALPALPAGGYRISVDAADSRGWLMVAIAREPRDPFAIRTLQLPVEPIDIEFPMAVRGLVIRGDEDAWRSVRGIVIEPLAILRSGDRLTEDLARRAVRYDGSTVYFLDDRSFPEPEAFWVGGARASTVVVQPDVERGTVAIRLRNGSAANRVTLRTGDWSRTLEMQPGQEEQLELPVDLARGAALVKIDTTAGFRPAEHDPASRDQRFLGVWIKVEK